MKKTWAQDQAEFMTAADQTIGTFNKPQLARYLKHIAEEVAEINEAQAEPKGVEFLDGLVDTIVVCIGAIHSMGVDPDKAWQAVHAANMRKVLPNGSICRRSDGQIGKPPGWYGPENDLMELMVKK